MNDTNSVTTGGGDFSSSSKDTASPQQKSNLTLIPAKEHNHEKMSSTPETDAAMSSAKASSTSGTTSNTPEATQLASSTATNTSESTQLASSTATNTSDAGTQLTSSTATNVSGSTQLTSRLASTLQNANYGVFGSSQLTSPFTLRRIPIPAEASAAYISYKESSMSDAAPFSRNTWGFPADDFTDIDNAIEDSTSVYGESSSRSVASHSALDSMSTPPKSQTLRQDIANSRQSSEFTSSLPRSLPSHSASSSTPQELTPKSEALRQDIADSQQSSETTSSLPRSLPSHSASSSTPQELTLKSQLPLGQDIANPQPSSSRTSSLPRSLPSHSASSSTPQEPTPNPQPLQQHITNPQPSNSSTTPLPRNTTSQPASISQNIMNSQHRSSAPKKGTKHPKDPSPDQADIVDTGINAIYKRESKISDLSLMFLPNIGILCGIHRKVPVLMIYAVYDHTPAGPSGLSFVTGFGSVIHLDDILFNVWFSSNDIEELSLKLQMNSQNAVKRLVQPYKDVDQVKGMLTFVSAFHKVACPAFATLPSPDISNRAEVATHIQLRNTPIWDFNPRMPQASPTDEYMDLLLLRHEIFNERYDTKLTFMDFLQGTFCLAGLLKVRLIPFEYDEKGNPFTQGEWFVDDFVARWVVYEDFVKDFSLVECPCPITWLIARLANEKRIEKKMKPWRGRVDVAQLAEPVMSWAFLQGLEWTRPQQYPLRYSLEGVRTRINTIVAEMPRTPKPAPKPVPKPRKVEVYDLTGGAMRSDGSRSRAVTDVIDLTRADPRTPSVSRPYQDSDSTSNTSTIKPIKKLSVNTPMKKNPVGAQGTVEGSSNIATGSGGGSGSGSGGSSGSKRKRHDSLSNHWQPYDPSSSPTPKQKSTLKLSPSSNPTKRSRKNRLIDSNIPKAVGQRRRKEGEPLSDNDEDDEFDAQIESNMPKPVGQRRGRETDPLSDREDDDEWLQDDEEEANDPFYLEGVLARNASAINARSLPSNNGLVEEAVISDEGSTADEEDTATENRDEDESTTEREDSPMFFPERSV